MYLKALEIQGFKSFPDKTVLNFGEDITAIVGPNGSGKSNISDAIRWVMGEQNSRQLRGAKMEDVIFGGTEKRRAMGFAQVTLVIDNTEHIFSRDEAEVAVTRRYYRSGESEYYINRQSVRLKDVNELFMDTGMGREGYSIIGQGKIDEILSVRSDDRREVFEEAAGISKYRHRKEESERKLQRTEENLVRINDKITELELQVEPLRKQAETAKKYLVLRDELRTLEISVWLENLQKLKADRLKLQADFETAQADQKKAQDELDRVYAQAEECSRLLHENDCAAEEKRGRISALESAIGEHESAAAVARTTAQHHAETIERMELIRGLRLGEFDVLVGINLLREGLDIPEVSMVAILDADKEGFLRSETSLIQTIGRAARNADGLVVLYADTITPSMRRAMDETERRRQIQDDYNKAHGIIPQTIRKDVREIIEISKKDEESARRRGKRKLSERERDEEIRKLEKQMQEASRMLEFEYAAILRDRIIELRKENTK